MAMNLIPSDRTIQSLESGRKRLSDGSGLYILSGQSDRPHSWRFDYVINGVRKTLSLGTYPAVSLANARLIATDFRARVAAGNDPSDVRKANKKQLVAERMQEKLLRAGLPLIGTFEEVARNWYGKKKTAWGKKYAQIIIRRLEIHVFPTLGRQMIADIKAGDIIAVCDKVQDSGAVDTGARVLNLCSQILRFAVARRCLPADPCRDLKGTLLIHHCKHFAAITNPKFLAEFLADIYKYEGTFVVATALMLLPMVFLRSSELRKALWVEFDLNQGLWRVPAIRMKRQKSGKENGPDHEVPLSKQAVVILSQLFKITGRTGRVFPGMGNAEFMSENTINKAIRRMGYSTKDEMTGHGFRATARTLLVERLGWSEDVVERQLAHTVKDFNGAAYNRVSHSLQRRKMMQSWSDYLDELRTKGEASQPDFVEFRPITSCFEPIDFDVKSGLDESDFQTEKLSRLSISCTSLTSRKN